MTGFPDSWDWRARLGIQVRDAEEKGTAGIKPGLQLNQNQKERTLSDQKRRLGCAQRRRGIEPAPRRATGAFDPSPPVEHAVRGPNSRRGGRGHSHAAAAVRSITIRFPVAPEQGENQ